MLKLLLRYGLDVNERIGAPILLRELGVLGALKVGRIVRQAKRRGEPFEAMAPPENEQDRLSREQIGPAIVLYRALRDHVGAQRALAITEAIVVEAACEFLRTTIGPLRRAELQQLDEAGVAAFAREKADRFFNATVDWQDISGDGLSFHVTHCRFPVLCAEVGVPELAPVFCAGDAKFFGTVEPDVELIRPSTIATGGVRCEFGLRFASNSDPR
jgi:hypothetical protein